MKKSLFFFVGLLLLGAYGCGSSNPPDDTLPNQPTEHTPAGAAESETTPEPPAEIPETVTRTDAQQIQFIKDEFYRIEEATDSLRQEIISYMDEEYPAESYSLEKFYDKNGHLVKMEYDFSPEYEASLYESYYFYDGMLYFAYIKDMSCSAISCITTENRYYFKNTNIIKHIITTTEKGARINPEGEMMPVDTTEKNELDSADSGTEERIINKAETLKAITLGEELPEYR